MWGGDSRGKGLPRGRGEGLQSGGISPMDPSHSPSCPEGEQEGGRGRPGREGGKTAGGSCLSQSSQSSLSSPQRGISEPPPRSGGCPVQAAWREQPSTSSYGLAHTCPQSALPWAWIHYPPPLSWRMVKEAKTHIQPQVNKPPTSCELPSFPRKGKGRRRTD